MNPSCEDGEGIRAEVSWLEENRKGDAVLMRVFVQDDDFETFQVEYGMEVKELVEGGCALDSVCKSVVLEV